MTKRKSFKRERHTVDATRGSALPAAIGRSVAAHPYAVAALGGAVALGALAFANRRQARHAEREHPPAGKFVEVDGVRLHYVERGHGDPLVLLHGNGTLIGDFETSGLVDLAAQRYRVIVFDRPGYGHSERPRSTVWSAATQADLLHAALQQLGVDRFLLLGHSWGAIAAAELALRYPGAVNGVVLASGYYYPTARVDALMMSGPAVPVAGDVLRYTLSPVVARAMWPLLMRKIFGPTDTPPAYTDAVKEMALRPSQIRASAAESALMIPGAYGLSSRYGEFSVPVGIIVGADDRLIDPEDQSGRLHEDVDGSILEIVPGAGHMVHHTAPDAVLSMIDRVARRAKEPGATDRPFGSTMPEAAE